MSGFEPKLANAFYNGRNNKGKSSTQKKRLRKDWVIMRQLVMTKKNPNLPEGH